MASVGQQLIDAAREAVPTMSNTDLNAQLTSGAPDVVLDVREPDESDAGHIPPGTYLACGRIEGRVE
jgi:rhodanese-related sulfurtransferase